MRPFLGRKIEAGKSPADEQRSAIVGESGFALVGEIAYVSEPPLDADSRAPSLVPVDPTCPFNAGGVAS
jgi:hypothetical protein